MTTNNDYCYMLSMMRWQSIYLAVLLLVLTVLAHNCWRLANCPHAHRTIGP